MALTSEVTKLFEAVPRHGYLTDQIKAHLHTGFRASTITATELVKLGERMKTQIADQKGKPDYQQRIEAFAMLQKQALTMTPDQALSHLLEKMPKPQTAIARVVRAIAQKVTRRKPVGTRPWHAIEKTVRSITVAQAPKGSWKQFAPQKFDYTDYITRIFKKFNPRRGNSLYLMRREEIANIFPKRPELYHTTFMPMISACYDYHIGAWKTPALVVEPLVQIDEADHKATVEVADDQLSLAIGKGGQNVRLAAKLTGWRIAIKGDGAITTSDEEDSDDIETSDDTKEDKETVVEKTEE